MSQKIQQNRNTSDNSMGILWEIILYIILFFLFLSFFHNYIIKIILKIKFIEIKLINFLLGNLFSNEIKILKNESLDNISYSFLINISNYVGKYIRYPITFISLILGIILLSKNISLTYKKKYTLESLWKKEVSNWSHIKPILNIDLRNENIKNGPWSMCPSPIEFCKKNKLLIKKNDENKYILNKKKTKRIFIYQMGNIWKNPFFLKKDFLILYGIFSCYILEKVKEAKKIIKKVNYSYKNGEVYYSKINNVIMKYGYKKKILNIIKNHAYEFTVLASMLQESRKNGILSVSNFLWIKPNNRVLWFMLSSIGRQTSFIESAGPFAHWKAEIKFKNRLLLPSVDEAIKGLERSLKEISYSSIEK